MALNMNYVMKHSNLSKHLTDENIVRLSLSSKETKKMLSQYIPNLNNKVRNYTLRQVDHHITALLKIVMFKMYFFPKQVEQAKNSFGLMTNEELRNKVKIVNNKNNAYDPNIYSLVKYNKIQNKYKTLSTNNQMIEKKLNKIYDQKISYHTNELRKYVVEFDNMKIPEKLNNKLREVLGVYANVLNNGNIKQFINRNTGYGAEVIMKNYLKTYNYDDVFNFMFKPTPKPENI